MGRVRLKQGQGAESVLEKLRDGGLSRGVWGTSEGGSIGHLRCRGGPSSDS